MSVGQRRSFTVLDRDVFESVWSRQCWWVFGLCTGKLVRSWFVTATTVLCWNVCERLAQRIVLEVRCRILSGRRGSDGVQGMYHWVLLFGGRGGGTAMPGRDAHEFVIAVHDKRHAVHHLPARHCLLGGNGHPNSLQSGYIQSVVAAVYLRSLQSRTVPR